MIDGEIIIVPQGLKNKLIKELSTKGIYNKKYLSMEEVYKSYYFTYDTRAIAYLMDKYHISYEIALIYLKNILYIENKDYESPKLDNLKKIKQDLDEHKLLIYDDLFINLIKGKTITVWGYNSLKKEDYKLIEELTKYASVKIDNIKCQEYKPKKVYSFKSVDDEIAFIASKICKLLGNKIPINNIKLLNVPSSYHAKIKRIFSFFNLKTTIETKITLYETPYGREYLKNFLLDLVKDAEIKQKIISVLNKYFWTNDYESIKDMLEYEFKNTTIGGVKYENSIEVVDFDYIPNDDDYIFCLAFNTSNVPKVLKDEEYITDDLADKLNKSTTIEVNKLEKNKVINKLKTIKNLTITYSKSDTNGECYPSVLVNELNLDIVTPQTNYKYSNIYNKLVLSSKLDKYLKYNEKSSDLELLYNNYLTNTYLSYENNFNKENIPTPSKVMLSYTTLDSYCRCSFRYYISSILKLNIYENTFMTYIGSLFHDILSKAFNEDFNFEEAYQNYIINNSYPFNHKEKFFLDKLKEELIFIIDVIKKQYTHTTFDKALYEKEVIIEVMNNVLFKGVIDKIMYFEKDGKQLISIIDYKTGNLKLNLNNVVHGIEMQLPIYLYLAQNISELSSSSIVGFYLQKILHNEITAEKGKSYLEQKEEALKLGGYTTDYEEYIKYFDDTYEDSKVIKSLKKSSKGFYNYSKVLSEEKINALIELVKNNIQKSSINILNGEFNINPKVIGKENKGCEYCKFYDICYKNNNNLVYLKEHKDLDFLES